MNRSVLEQRLRRSFEGTDRQFRVVSRMAGDLADSGVYAADEGHELGVHEVVGHLESAPEGNVVARWNWWMGALEIAYGGYERFSVRQ
ncbi:MAG: hypothetical protein ABEJ76_06870 [Halanaeroarchaeum sp.]